LSYVFISSILKSYTSICISSISISCCSINSSNRYPALLRDIKASDSDGNFWKFDIKKSVGMTMTITLDLNSGVLPDGYKVIIEDLERGVGTEVTAENGYSYVSEKGVVIVGLWSEA